MSDLKSPKREFNPRSHAMIYLLAMVYLAWLIVQMVKDYLAGGPDAPSFSLLLGGIALLGGGCILLGVLARKMLVTAPKEEDRDVRESDGEAEAGETEAVSDVKKADSAKVIGGEGKKF